MTHQIHSIVSEFSNKYGLKDKKVLEIGSLNVNGGIKDIFINHLGTDMRDGDGVDVVANGNNLSKIKDTYDVVVCLETLEHDLDFHKTLKQMDKKLLVGGYMIISTPTFGFPLHRYPRDYWRFSTDVYEDLFFAKPYMLVEIREIEDDAGYPGIIAIGVKCQN